MSNFGLGALRALFEITFIGNYTIFLIFFVFSNLNLKLFRNEGGGKLIYIPGTGTQCCFKINKSGKDKNQRV